MANRVRVWGSKARPDIMAGTAAKGVGIDMGSQRHDRVLVLWLPGLLAALGHRRQVLRVVDHAVDFHSLRVEAARDVANVAVAHGRHEHHPVLVGQVDPDAGPTDLVDQGPLPDAVDGIPTRVCDGAVEVVGVALSPVALTGGRAG